MDVALETSHREASVALGIGALLFTDEFEELDECAHASDLLPRLAGLIQRTQRGPVSGRPTLERVFAGLGPGSYTGLRVGLASALGLARAAEARLYGLSSFEALAYGELMVGESGAVLLEARAARYYWGELRRAAADVEVLVKPELCRESELPARCAAVPILLVPERLAATLPAGLECSTEVRRARPRADSLLALGRARIARGGLEPVAVLEPLYLAEFGAR